MGIPRKPGVPSYAAVHARINVGLGPARVYMCDCGKRAAEWAYDGLDEDQHYGRTAYGSMVFYSSNLDHYKPMCIPCHRKLDSDRRKGEVRTRDIMSKIP